MKFLICAMFTRKSNKQQDNEAAKITKDLICQTGTKQTDSNLFRPAASKTAKWMMIEAPIKNKHDIITVCMCMHVCVCACLCVWCLSPVLTSYNYTAHPLSHLFKSEACTSSHVHTLQRSTVHLTHWKLWCKWSARTGRGSDISVINHLSLPIYMENKHLFWYLCRYSISVWTIVELLNYWTLQKWIKRSPDREVFESYTVQSKHNFCC